MEKSLKQLIREGEGSALDFKKTITHLDKIAKTMVSFANNKGGKILIGVMDDRQIKGISPEEEKYMILEAAAHYCDPPLAVSFEEVEEEDDKIVLIVDIPEGHAKPYRAKSNKGDWQVYIRSNDQSVLACKMVTDVLRTETLQKEASRPREYTYNELSLIVYLHRRNKITLKDYARLVNISKRRASKILTDLVLEGEILFHNLERTAFYTLRRH
jgi:predicted HTH transcriptional regulator